MGRSLICSLGLVSLRLQAAGVITVSIDQKKQNSPLPAAVAGRLVVCLADAQFGSDPPSGAAAAGFWPRAGGASRARNGSGVALVIFDGGNEKDKCSVEFSEYGLRV